MPTLLMCPHRSDLQSLIRFHGVPEGSLLDRWGREPEWLSARVPYLLGSDYGHDELDYCRMLEPHGGLLCDMCQDFGGAATVGLAEISFDLRRSLHNDETVVGAAAGVYESRVARFREAMQRHQRAIDDHFLATHPRAPKTLSSRATREALLRSGADLSRMFRHELAVVTRSWFARSRMLVSGGAVVPDRVRNNPKISRLDVASRTAASTLVELGRYAKYLGRSLLVIDLGRRLRKVHDVEHSGGDWHRQAAIESAGFAGAIGGGAIGVDLGAAALGAMVMLTPAGWALVVGSVVATGVAVAGSIAFAQVAEGLAAQHYDRVREFQESLR